MLRLIAGTPLADAVQNAQAHLDNSEIALAAEQYTIAVSLLNGREDEFALRRGLWLEHLDGLAEQEQFSIGHRQAERYIQQATQQDDEQTEHELLIRLAEFAMARGDSPLCFQYLTNVTRRWGNVANWESVARDCAPRLIRLEGLLACEAHQYERGEILLNQSLLIFAEIDHKSGCKTVRNDIRRLNLLVGDGSAVDEILTNSVPQTTYELILFARALQRDARYETAARLIEQHLAHLKDRLEPVWRFPILHELALLYDKLSDKDKVLSLLPLLKEAITTVADQAEAIASIQRLSDCYSEGFTPTSGSSFEARIANVRSLIQNCKLADAENALNQLRKNANGLRLGAMWMLVAGELEFALSMDEQTQYPLGHGKQSVAQLHRAAKLAHEASLPNVLIQSNRLLGRVYEHIFQDLERANYYWSRAARTEELFAQRQETDRARIRLLEAAPTEFDELIDATASKVTVSRVELIAPVIAAIESARGAAILSQIRPADAKRMRDVPLASNAIECVEWVEKTRRRLPRNMAIWLLHATPTFLHHGLIAKNFLHWECVSIDRHQLSNMIEELGELWLNSPAELEKIVINNPVSISGLLLKLSRTIEVEQIISALPDTISRLAIVAGDALGDIPFAALPYKSTEERKSYLISKYALSFLPCLSAQHVMKVQARKVRGKKRLAIQPSADELASEIDGRLMSHTTQLVNSKATISDVLALLQQSKFSIIRFDCHGSYNHDGNVYESWLKLEAGEQDNGHLTANHFSQFPLTNCGTLILGACESGMSRRIGRDERLGFVRAGFIAGAASVLAANWTAADLPTKQILDQFELNLRFLPRDVALQKAILRYLMKCGPYDNQEQTIDIIDPAHPARWGCWTLYGDSGLQATNNLVTRSVLKLIDDVAAKRYDVLRCGR